MTESEKAKAMVLKIYGCGHHHRNIGFGWGHTMVEAHLRKMLKNDLDELKQKGIRCVDGKTDMTLRSIFKFFGNTTVLNYLSVGKEFRKWISEHTDYKDDTFLDCGRCDLGNRQDGISEHCFMMQTRVKKMLEFITEFHWSPSDNSYWPAIETALDSEPLKIQRMLYALLFHQVIQVHRTAVGMGGVGKESGKPYIDMPQELVDQGLPERLPTLGPLGSMQMMIKIREFMDRATGDPQLLLSRRGWREVFEYDEPDPWSELFEWRGMYNEHIHSQGGGCTAGNVKTESNFHSSTVESLLEQAQEYKDNALFETLAGMFCSAFSEGLEDGNNDYGWFQKFRDNDKSASAAAFHRHLALCGIESNKSSTQGKSKKRKGNGKGSAVATKQEDIAALRENSRNMKPYSMNEPYFGSLKQKYAMNCQVRIDGLAAQATEEQNGSFRTGERLSKFDKAAALVLRKWVRGKRKKVRSAYHAYRLR
jgi:hypothetical protein